MLQRTVKCMFHNICSSQGVGQNSNLRFHLFSAQQFSFMTTEERSNEGEQKNHLEMKNTFVNFVTPPTLKGYVLYTSPTNFCNIIIN